MQSKPAIRRDLFGGSGEVAVWDVMRGASLAPFTAALWCELAPGGSVGAHVQQEFPEIVICVDGQGSARVDGAITALSPGTLVALPLGSSLALSNDSQDKPLRYIIVKARAL